MMRSGIDALLKNPVSFLTSIPSDEICISSRVRLSRNLNGLPFPGAGDEGSAARVVELVKDAGEKITSAGCPECFFFEMSGLDDMDRSILLERRLVSRELISSAVPSAVLVSGDESISVMINEEDHIRMQILKPGFQLQECWKELSALDDELAEELDYAWDDKLGYLTACPTNIGTGLRASVMLHLPGLVMSGQIAPTMQGINKLGLAVRGIFGEGSDNRGNLYQVSNQITLGENEENIIEQLSAVIRQLVEYERRARRSLLEQDRFSVLDRVGRAYGILQHSYKLAADEALNSLSGVRLGVDLGLFRGVRIHTVNELFLELGDGHLQKRAGVILGREDLEILRAKLFRSKMRGIE